jgi:hypothetical protein
MIGATSLEYVGAVDVGEAAVAVTDPRKLEPKSSVKPNVMACFIL